MNIDSKQAEKINNRLTPPGSLSKNKEKRRDSGRRRRLLDSGGRSPLYGDCASCSSLIRQTCFGRGGKSYDLDSAASGRTRNERLDRQTPLLMEDGISQDIRAKTDCI